MSGFVTSKEVRSAIAADFITQQSYFGPCALHKFKQISIHNLRLYPRRLWQKFVRTERFRRSADTLYIFLQSRSPRI